MRRTAEGFTLIELMIVIAIIAVIAAIAIPGLLRSQRSSNERSASATMKTLATAQADFRANDRDGNMVKDYWVRDVSGLYSLCPNSVSDPIKLIEVGVAGADAEPLGAGAVGPGTEAAITTFTPSSAKASYWFIALLNDDTGTPYGQNTSGLAPLGANPYFSPSTYAFMCFPDARQLGQYTYWISEGNTIYRRSIAQTYARPVGNPPGGGTDPIAAQLQGAAPTNQWPTDAQLQADYSKLD